MLIYVLQSGMMNFELYFYCMQIDTYFEFRENILFVLQNTVNKIFIAIRNKTNIISIQIFIWIFLRHTNISKHYLLVQNYYLISYEKKTFHAFAQYEVLKVHFIEKYTDNYICSPSIISLGFHYCSLNSIDFNTCSFMYGGSIKY